MDSTISQMSEAWEDILMEMDSKLMKFAEEKAKVCGGCVSNDFLRLLMLGKPRSVTSISITKLVHLDIMYKYKMGIFFSSNY